MKDFEAAVADATREHVKSGLLTKLVTDQVAKTMKSIVEDSLSAYSPFGKQLKETIVSQLSIDPSKIGLEAYNQTVLAIIRQKLDSILDLKVREKISKQMEELLGTDAPASIKLSKLVEEFKKWAREQYGHKSSCTIVLEEKGQYSSRWLYLDLEPRQTVTSSRFAMLISDDGKVTFHRFQGVDPKGGAFLGPVYGFERFLFQMYAAGTEIEIDEEDFDNSLVEDSD